MMGAQFSLMPCQRMEIGLSVCACVEIGQFLEEAPEKQKALQALTMCLTDQAAALQHCGLDGQQKQTCKNMYVVSWDFWAMKDLEGGATLPEEK